VSVSVFTDPQTGKHWAILGRIRLEIEDPKDVQMPLDDETSELIGEITARVKASIQTLRTEFAAGLQTKLEAELAKADADIRPLLKKKVKKP